MAVAFRHRRGLTVFVGLLVFGCLAALPRHREVRAEATPSATSQDAVLQAATTIYDGMHVETLPNGLRVFLKPMPKSPVVTTVVAYKVGSADEDLGHTGLSHYLEHLMF